MPGIISVFVLVAGFYYLQLIDALIRSMDVTSKLILVMILFFVPGFLTLEVINIWLGNTLPRNSSDSDLNTSTQSKKNKKFKRFWAWHLSVFFSLPLSILGAFFLTRITVQFPEKQVFILVIAFNYALLALSRWGEVKDLEKQDQGALE
jgi:hypothetical protein